jgi:uncharacterized protein DUF551
MNWHRTADEQPSNNDYVLIWVFGRCEIGSFLSAEYLQDAYWIFNSTEWRWDTVSHWMPLPKPPKE